MQTVAAFIIALVIMLTLATWYVAQQAPSIGGTDVPSRLDCAEDELIAFVAPDTLDCVHIDVITGRG